MTGSLRLTPIFVEAVISALRSAGLTPSPMTVGKRSSIRTYARAADAALEPAPSAIESLCCKMAEYTAAIVAGKPAFHISLIMDVSPNCDCHGENDAPILPNIGMLASFDPVAIDQAGADLCLKADPVRNSQLGDNLAREDWHHHHDHFLDSNPNIKWKETLEHGEKIGLGTREYELIRV